MSMLQSLLGKKIEMPKQYTPDVLFPIDRQSNRDDMGMKEPLPFFGCDVWNYYDMSWLNAKGKPMVARAEFVVPVNSKNLIESKSLKLYFCSFNQTKFETAAQVHQHMVEDLSKVAGAPVSVTLYSVADHRPGHFARLEGVCLDELDVQTNTYFPTPEILNTENDVITESVHSHLLRSNCPVTHQPDFASVQIDYTGAKINHDNLLKYLISLRNDQEFHEHCVERIFMDILKRCKPTDLTVYARYTRRGGLDINPYRSMKPISVVPNPRLVRQ